MTALQIADTIAHFLYCPTMLGRRVSRVRWHHTLHLIPRALLDAICDRYEATLDRE